MHLVEIVRRPTAAQRDAVARFVETVTTAAGARPLSDHLWFDLRSPEGSPLLVTIADHDGVLALAQISMANDNSALELVVAPRVDDDSVTQITTDLVETAVEAFRHDGGGNLSWWVDDPAPDVAELARRCALEPGRTLYEMRRPLPTGQPAEVTTRPFEPGIDDEDWLAVNNRAFAAHGEQGGWTSGTLAARLAEPWFDADGFRLHERDGRLAAFCWTKLHLELDPVVGEIYVIAVDPDFHGLGLGRQLTLAGLDSIADRGVRVANLYVDAHNEAAVSLYRSLDFDVHHTRQVFTGRQPGERRDPLDESVQGDTMNTSSTDADPLPRWSVADVHESLDARSVTDAMEQIGAGATRLAALFDEHDVRATEPRPVTADDGLTADAVIRSYNSVVEQLEELAAVVYATVTTDSRDERAQALASQLDIHEATITPLLARLADWVHALGVDELAAVSGEVHDHRGPLTRLDERAHHQMSESEEGLYAELATTGSAAWGRLQQDVTSQLTTEIRYPDGRTETLPMPAIRGLATSIDPEVRRAAFDAELEAWPTVAAPVAAAMNAIKGEANTVNRRRRWDSPLDASLFGNSVSRATFEAMHAAVTDALPDFRRWMRTKATLHGHADGLPWWDLVAPLPHVASSISWTEGIDWVRSAFATYSDELAGLVDRALDERWIDAEPRDGKTGGAFCMSFTGDRSLVLLNWAGSVDSAQTTAHELGHAYHNTTLAGRTPLQRRLPMALAETASIFCETLAVEAGLARLDGPERLALLDVDLAGSSQVVVDIRSRFLFESAVFDRRRTGTIGVSELNELMLAAQAEAYGDGLDAETRHPYMWLLKPHYYGSHFYNWPYTYGLLFGLGLYARYQADPERFRTGYDDLLSRAGIDTAEELGAAFGLDVTDVEFWTASLDVCRDRIGHYEALAAEL